MSLMRSSQLEPLSKARAADVAWSYYKKIVGSNATGLQIAMKMFSSPVLNLANKYESYEEILSDPFYRTYFARSDPFFKENVEPFDPGIPLYVAVSGVDRETSGERPENITEPGYRAKCLCLPKIETLRSWGWTVYYKYNPDRDVISWEGEGLEWTLKNLRKELYGELNGEERGITGTYLKVFFLCIVIIVLLLLVYGIRTKKL